MIKRRRISKVILWDKDALERGNLESVYRGKAGEKVTAGFEI